MAKKPAAKKICEIGGDEIITWSIHFAPATRVEFSFWICSAGARIRLWLQPEDSAVPQLLLDDEGKSHLALQLPDLSAGRYLLWWSFITAAKDWQTRVEVATTPESSTEVQPEGTTRFRQRKTSTGANPVNTASVALVVR